MPSYVFDWLFVAGVGLVVAAVLWWSLVLILAGIVCLAVSVEG